MIAFKVQPALSKSGRSEKAPQIAFFNTLILGLIITFISLFLGSHLKADQIQTEIDAFWADQFNEALYPHRSLLVSAVPFSDEAFAFPDLPSYYLALDGLRILEHVPAITNPDVIGNYTSLKRLWMTVTDGDLTFLERLKHLQELELELSSAQDLSPIGEHEHLSSLAIIGEKSYDLGQIDVLPNLRVFRLYGTGFENLNSIAKHPKIGTLVLSIGKAQAVDLRWLGSLKNFRYLDARGTALVDLGFILNLPGIFVLKIGDSEVTDIGPLSHAKHLKTLDVTGLRLRNPEVLLALPRLEKITGKDAIPGYIIDKLMNKGVQID